MPYVYGECKKDIFTVEGQRMLLSIRDEANELFESAGCAKLGKIIAKETGNSWTMLACIDMLVELGEIRCVYENQNAHQFSIYEPE